MGVLRSLIMCCCFFLGTYVFAHGSGDERSEEETLEVYRQLLLGLENSVYSHAPIPLTTPFVYQGTNKSYKTGDALTQVLIQILAQSQIQEGPAEENHSQQEEDHCTECAKENSIKKWRKNLNKFVLTMPSLFVQGFKQYGVSYAAYTLISEVVEHVLIPHPAFCKALQGFYFASAGLAASSCRVFADPFLRNKKIGERVNAAFKAAQSEFYFKYVLKNKIHRGEIPELTLLTQKNFQIYLEKKTGEIDLLRELLAESLFWSELLTEAEDLSLPVHQNSLHFETLLTNNHAEESKKIRLWRAYRISAYLDLFLEIIQNFLDSRVTEEYMHKDLSWTRYNDFLYLKAAVGQLGKLLEIYKSQLLSNAVLNSQSGELKASSNGLFESLKVEIIPHIRRAAELLNKDISRDEIRLIQKYLERESLEIKNRRSIDCEKALEG